MIRILLIVFHIGMVLTVLGLEISKSYVIAATVGTTNSVSLSVYWLILLVLLPAFVPKHEDYYEP